MGKHTRIAHHVPERTRLKLSEKHRSKEEMRRIGEALESSPKARRVEVSPETGSIIVHHLPGALPDIRAILEDLGVVVASTTEIGLPSGDDQSALGAALVQAVNDLDRRLRLSSGGIFDLKVLIPAGLAALAVRQVLRQGLRIEAAPWYVLAYLAFDSFVKLHRPRGPGPERPD